MPTADGGYLITGCFDKVLSPFGVPPPVKKFALMAKLDRFGKVLWSKTIANYGGDMNFSSVYETTDGDFIAYLCTDNGKKKVYLDHNCSRVLRMGANGKIKWSTLMYTDPYDAGGLGVNFKQGITQTAGKNIIVADVVHKSVFRNTKYIIQQGNLHFMEFDYATGKINWESSYEYPVPPADTLYTPDITAASQLPDGRLAFVTSLYLSTPGLPALTKKAALLITSNKGAIENLFAYYPSGGNACQVTEAISEPASQTKTLLLKSGTNTLLANIDYNGTVKWSRLYNSEGGLFPVTSFSAGKKGYNIFMGNFRGFTNRLLITDSAGLIGCAEIPANLIAEPAAFDFPKDSVHTDINKDIDSYADYELPFRATEDYPLEKDITCQQTAACCTDFIDSAHTSNITICEGKTYILPDGTPVKEPGRYYVVTKSPLGCDSIKYYSIKTDKDVSKLDLGNDSCLTQSATVKLFATPGYEKYYWQNSTIAGADSFTISMPGKYSVRVSNTCGTKTDSITIFNQCDYPVYMPSAFTPNNDGLNDYYGISSMNKNWFISFKIYNRWGQLVFETGDARRKWDGRFKNEQQQSGIFLYYIEMKGLSGNPITVKGSFILLR